MKNPFGNKWLKRAWNQFATENAPWINLSKTARIVLVAPVLAVLLSIANLIETWTTELVINPILGLGGFGVDLVQVLFYGRNSFPRMFGDGTFGLMRALNTSWAGILNFVGGFSLPALPVALLSVGAMAYLIGRVINRG